MPFQNEIDQVRAATVAVLRIHRVNQNQIGAIVAGTAWAFSGKRFFLTANHVFNGGQPRDPNDRFYLFCVPANGPRAFRLPVMNFVFEDAVTDTAIIEVDPSTNPQFTVQPLPISVTGVRDGSDVITVGFPEPKISNARIDQNLNWLGGGSLFLKSYADVGIVSGQYELSGHDSFEFNVAWFQGESGGPVCIADPLSAISIMQTYRNINTQHGVVPGPRRGISLKSIEAEIRNVGGQIV